MKYGEEYNLNDVLLGIGRAVTYFEEFKGQTERNEYSEINLSTPERWYELFSAPYVNDGSYALAKELSNGGIQWSNLNNQEKQQIRDFVHRFSSVQLSFAPTNLNALKDDTFDAPGWRFYATEARKYASFEPQAYYLLGVTGYCRVSFCDPNIDAYVGQPGHWGTRYFVAEDSSDNDVLLFYSSFSGVYHNKNSRDAIYAYHRQRAQEITSGSVTKDWTIKKGSEKFDLLEYRVVNYRLVDYINEIGDAFWAISENFVEQRLATAISDVLTYEGVIGSGFSWYLNRKPDTNETYPGTTNQIGSYGGVPFGTANIVIYRPFDEDTFAEGSQVCGLLNPSKSAGTTDDALTNRSLSERKRVKRYDISDLSISVHPKGVAEIQAVPHHPTSFMGIGAFVNYFPDTTSYETTELYNDSGKDIEYGASFPLSPTVESFQLDSEYDDKTKNKLDADYNYYDSGYNPPLSASKNQYIETIFSGNTNNGNFGRTKSSGVVLNYSPKMAYGKNSEAGRYWTAQSKYTFYVDELSDLGDSDVIIPAENEDRLFHTFDGTVFPFNHAVKFGDTPEIYGFEISGFAGSGFHFIEAFNYQKQISRYSKFDINRKDSSLYSLTNSQAASRFGHCEFFKRNHTEESSPSSCTDTYHVFATNTATGTVSITGYNDEGDYSTGNVPWQNTLNVGLSQYIIDGNYYDSVSSTIYGNSLIGYSKSYFNTGNILYYGIDRVKNLNYSDGIYAWPDGPIIPSNDDLTKIWATLQYGRGASTSRDYLYLKSLNRVISQYNPTYTNNTELNIYWQSQSYLVQDYGVFEEIQYSGNPYPIFRIDNEWPYYTPPSKNLVNHIDSVDGLNRYSLGLFGGIEFKNQVKNGLFYEYVPKSTQIIYPDTIFNKYNSVFQSTCQKHTRKASTIPVLTWGVDAQAYKRMTGLYPWYSDMPIAETGMVVLSNEKWHSNTDAENKDGSIYITYDTLGTQDPPYCKLYGTPASVKHRNVGKAFTHPDICYNYNDYIYGFNEAENEASQFINFRVEFSGMRRASRNDSIDFSSLGDVPDSTEYEELFYNFSEEESLLVGVKRKYKGQRPVIPNNLVIADPFIRTRSRDLYNYAPIDLGIGYLARPQTQAPISSEINYYGGNRLPPELLGNTDNIEYPTIRYGDAYKWQEDEDYVIWWDEYQEKLRKLL